MTDVSAPAPSTAPPPRVDAEPLGMPIAVYVLYILGFFTGGLAAIVGVVLAYVQRSDAGPRAASHYVFAINTFWIMVVAIAASTLLAILGLPMLFLHGAGIVLFLLSGLIGAAGTIWFLVRCVVGLVRAAQGEGCAAPRSWLL
ncbi:MAG: hypothetical protein INR64_02265 [Caulobacteraceae bacterium]|nr:hypothetical protein [Caulobacter sp.]